METSIHVKIAKKKNEQTKKKKTGVSLNGWFLQAKSILRNITARIKQRHCRARGKQIANLPSEDFRFCQAEHENKHKM